MSKRARIRASGAVVFRGEGDDLQVLIIHRPKYDDWTLPKGKGKADELAPHTAVREVAEETGAVVRLGLRLPSVKYQLAKGPKTVSFWRASVVGHLPWKPNAEVDEVLWLPVDEAMRRLTYADERRVVSAALLTSHSTPLLLVRHCKAMLRKDWTGPDQERRLTGRGRRQAHALIPLLSAYGVEHLVSSSSTRCADTLRPYGGVRGLPVVTHDLLTEEEGAQRPDEVTGFVSGLFHEFPVPTALCGHRPVLPAMLEGLGLPPRPMVVSEVMVVHRDDRGEKLAVEVHKPTA